MAQFYYCTCQVGAEKVVKTEVLAAQPGLRFAFSRPGFITFKQEKETGLIAEAPSIFVRIWGKVIGQAKIHQPEGEQAFQQLLSEIPADALVHVFDRDSFEPGHEPKGYQPSLRGMQALQSQTLKFQRLNQPAAPHQWVYDLIWIDEGHFFLGRHLHEEGQDPSPGARPVFLEKLDVNSQIPSRAYYKMLEAWQRFLPEMSPGSVVLELGSSPGGASLALLEKDLKVYAVDPKKPDDRLFDHQHFYFLKKTAKSLHPNDLKSIKPSLLVMDINLSPPMALQELAHVVSLLRSVHGQHNRLQQAMLTLKLNEWELTARIPQFLQQIRDMGFDQLKAVQLASNHKEFFVWAKKSEPSKKQS